MFERAFRTEYQNNSAPKFSNNIAWKDKKSIQHNKHAGLGRFSDELILINFAIFPADGPGLAFAPNRKGRLSPSSKPRDLGEEVCQAVDVLFVRFVCCQTHQTASSMQLKNVKVHCFVQNHIYSNLY